MSPRSSKAVSTDAPAPGIYDALLFVSLAALITGVIFLVLALGTYGWKVSP